MDYKDKVVWITGASSGIGEHLAYAFAEQEAVLVLSSRNEKELERVKNNCQNAKAVHIQILDVADFASIPEKVNQVISRVGFVNVLVNNAGISQRALARETDFSVDQRIMNINYLGTVALTKAILPSMIKQNFGQIVVISSVLGKYGVPFRTAYCASKHALHGFFDSLRAELHDENIQVTLICPGYVNTNVTINALRGDGSPNSVMAESTRKGYEPDEFAQKALRIISHAKPEVYIGRREAFAVYVNRFLPSVFRRIARGLQLR